MEFSMVEREGAAAARCVPTIYSLAFFHCYPSHFNIVFVIGKKAVLLFFSGTRRGSKPSSMPWTRLPLRAWQVQSDSKTTVVEETSSSSKLSVSQSTCLPLLSNPIWEVDEPFFATVGAIRVARKGLSFSFMHFFRCAGLLSKTCFFVPGVRVMCNKWMHWRDYTWLTPAGQRETGVGIEYTLLVVVPFDIIPDITCERLLSNY